MSASLWPVTESRSHALTVPGLSSHRDEAWVWRLLDLDDNETGILGDDGDFGVTEGSLEMNVYADTRHSGSMTWVGPAHEQPNWLRSRIQPVYTATLLDGSTVEWPMGVYLPATPAVTVKDGVATAQVDLYDKTLVLRQDRLAEDFAYEAGTNPIAAVWDQVIGATGTDPSNVPAIEETSETLRTALFWEAGTSRLRIVNDLLDAAGYFGVWVDGEGRFRSAPYRAPRSRPVVWEFAPGEWSIHKDGVTRTADSFNVPNRVIAVATGTGDEEALVAEAVNIDPADPYSYQSRGRWVTSEPLQVDATSLSVLQGHAERSLAAARQLSTTLDVDHALVPLSGNDRVRFTDPAWGTVDAVVRSWRFDCAPGSLVRSTLLEVT